MAKGKRLCPPGKVLKGGKCVSKPNPIKLKKGQQPRTKPMEMEIPMHEIKKKKKY